MKITQPGAENNPLPATSSFSAAMKIALCTRRTLLRAVAVLLGLVLVGFADGRVVRGIASFLIVEDPLEHAAAIITLGGQLPFREMEAAKLYRDGWAPQVIIVRSAPSAEAEALQALKIKKPQEWELSSEVLRQQGVPAAAIVIPKGEGIGTLEELQAAYAVLGGAEHGAWSKEHAAEDQTSEVRGQKTAVTDGSMRRAHQAQSTPRTYNAGSVPGLPSTVLGHPSSVALASAKQSGLPASQLSSKQQLPVILVTSKYHTRRTRLTWNYVTGGKSQPIVRAASGDPFDPEHWWRERSFVLSVVREYLGLINYYAGFPIGAGR